MTATHSPPTIYLRRDYQASPFLVDRVDLTFDIREQSTRVHSRLLIKRNRHAITHHNLVLHGSASLNVIHLDGEVWPTERYELNSVEETLTLFEVPESFILEIETEVFPEKNTSLMGLYASNGNLFTQCEPEGFRKITYYLDRPDVMAKFSTTLIADKTRYPVLLSNGNKVGQGLSDKKRHWVKWVDPYRKPSYLFAVVAGKLAVVRDEYLTRSGRKVALEIYVEAHDVDKTQHALRSLKRAMKWDEDRFGLEYDLDTYMIVAVSDFNMGAMENKGLNVFNTKFVLARQDTATDFDFEGVESVIGHEYFHNWTGNRVTCRDWFQLSLKEGLTVFRDQEFTADLYSRAVKRIEDVRQLRTAQFPEDAGPTAHPIRPDSYIEMNNFYTMTVYEKGAEVVRMYQTLFGREGFRKGLELYFRRHDGHAVTCDDFRQAMADANQYDLTQFERWYDQAGTPEVAVEMFYHPSAHSVTLHIRQHCPPTPGQTEKAPFLIPLTLALFDPNGHAYPLQMSEESEAQGNERVLILREREHSFTFIHIDHPPIPSLLRDFSAPVKLHYHYSAQELAFLFAHDTDAFNRWEAGQVLFRQTILQQLDHPQSTLNLPSVIVEGVQRILHSETLDPAFKALALTLPSEVELFEAVPGEVDPVALVHAREMVKVALARSLRHEWQTMYQRCQRTTFRHEDNGWRSLKNLCLAYLNAVDDPIAVELAQVQYQKADNMTDQAGALSALRDRQGTIRDHLYEDFAQRWQKEALVMDKWFALHAASLRSDTLSRTEALLQHPCFSLKNPNKARAVLGSFGRNLLHFHAADGSGYRFLAQKVLEIDQFNPQVASRLVSLFNRWTRLEPQRRQLMKQELTTIEQQPGLSRDVFEIVSKSLEATH